LTPELKEKGKKKGPVLIPTIPISGWKGDNLIKPSTNMPWFKKWTATTPSGVKVSGITLFEALDQFVEPVARDLDKPLRMPLSGCIKMKAGTVVTGRIEQGQLQKEVKTKTGVSGTPVKFFPSGLTAKVFSIEAHHREQPKAVAGDNVGICIKNLQKGLFPKAGEVMCVVDDADKKIGKTKSFTASVKIQDHPGKLKVGYTPLCLVRTAKCACKVTKINWHVPKADMKKIKKKKDIEKYKVENPKFIQKGEQAEIVFEPQLPFTVQAFTDCEGLGRVAVLESNSLVMLGKIIAATNEPVKDI